MRPVLLDASCVLAWLFDETGADSVEQVLTSSYITSVNMAEVISKVERISGQGSEVAHDLVEAGLTVVPVGWAEIRATAGVRRLEYAATTPMNLSLGDVLCLDYALAHDMTVWTADRAWLDLKLQLDLVAIR